MLARTLVMGSRIGQPFFLLFAARVLGVDPATTLAVLSLAYMGADTISNLIWGYLSDHHGFRSTFVIFLSSSFRIRTLIPIGSTTSSGSGTTRSSASRSVR